MIPPTYHIYVSEGSSVFVREIAAVLTAALADLGYGTIFPSPGLPERGLDRINLVVAPHEFFPLQKSVRQRDLLRAAEASVAVGLAQPGTASFELGVHYASVGATVLDLSSTAVDELQKRGADATYLQLGYHSSWDKWGGEPTRPRPTDLLFLGAITERRSQILASAGPLLWDCAADIRLFESARPTSELRANFVAGREKWELLSSSRVLLNIHHNEILHLEWIRILEAIVNGCLVISDPSTEHRPLMPGKHLIEAPTDVLAAYAASILTDEPLRAEMAASAYNFVRSQLSLTTQLKPICDHVETAVAKTFSRRAAVPFHAPEPMASAPLIGPSEPVESPPNQLRVQARVTDLITTEKQLIQRVEALDARFLHGDADHVETFVTTAWDGCTPDISVVVTSYNYRHFIIEAMQSAMSSVGVTLELIVVDDHSQDGSVTAVQDFMSANDWFPLMLVARAANAGPSVARNIGVAHARGDRIFILDADNLIYPTTLRKLSAALDRCPDAAFAYGILTKSDGEDMTSDRLVSHLPWDVKRLCRFNYIDAMTLLRASVLEEVGGFDVHFGAKGCDDYELWLRLAASGHSAAFVREYVGSYRVHPASFSNAVLPDLGTLVSELSKRFPSLPWHEG